ncbi:MAG: AAA family ATPase [Bryobacterales bacterium]|nr:AAA family ATPase [Bryobacterales bacterium]
MKFLSVELEHVFAYDRKATVDLSGTTEDQNIVLIWGRNGMGKTSFLNALKLLFTGVEHPSSRVVGFPPRSLPPRQYVVGDGAGWSGLINQPARRRAENEGRPVVASVKAMWEADGLIVTAEREWKYDGATFMESLLVFDGKDRLVKEAAEARLEDFLPKDFVGFFFFDGEDIKSMAENAERKQIDFDRLLRITFLTEATAELKKYITERQRAMTRNGVFETLHAVEVELTRTTGEAEVARHKLEEIDDRLLNDTVELRRLTTRRENLSSGASEAQREALDTRRLALRGQLDETSAAIATELPPDVPMLANLGLVHQALEAVETRLGAAGAAEVALVRRVRTELPAWIEEAPVDLDPTQIAALSQAIGDRLDALVAGSSDNGLFSTIELGRADRLRTSLLRWATLGPDRRGIQVAKLTEAQRFRVELEQVEEALMEIEVGSQANLETYKKVVAEIAKIEDRIAEYNQRKGVLDGKLNELAGREKELKERQKRLQESRDAEAEKNRHLRFYNAVVRTLNEVTEGLRREMRGRIESLINNRLQLLLTDHPLIDKITLDESYTMFFLDGAGRPIGRSSLSSGMKQLAATALLWAMKDSAGYGMPVVIDTPLARIDRINQTNLLRGYYPKLSHQVIVLPTDAEIDQTKLEMLRPYIWKEFTLRNQDTGESAEIVEESLVGD